MTTVMEGGIAVPNEPLAQMVPEIRDLSYWCLSMTGTASMPITASVAPTTPLAAAKMVPMMTAPTPSPPGIRRVHRWMAPNSRSAMPEFSSIAPMKMNKGTAARMELDAVSSILVSS